MNATLEKMAAIARAWTMRAAFREALRSGATTLWFESPQRLHESLVHKRGARMHAAT